MPLLDVPVTGSAFATNASVRRNGLRVTAGKELISEYESSPGNFRRFCSRCGSPLFGRSMHHPNLRVRLGSLDQDPGVRPSAHIFTGSKAPWDEISDKLEQFEEAAPVRYFLPG